MPTAQVQTKSAIASSATSVNVSLSAVGAGNHLNASVYSNNAATTATTSTPTATWANALAQATHFLLFRNDYSENVASGSWTVSGKASAASTIAVCVSESSGVATANSLGLTVQNLVTSAGTTIQPGSMTPTAGSILYSGASSGAGSGFDAPTIDSGFTVAEPGGGGGVWEPGTWNMAAGTAYLAAAAASATNPTWTTGANWGAGATWGDAFMVEFKATAAASTPTAAMLVPTNQPMPDVSSVVSY